MDCCASQLLGLLFDRGLMMVAITGETTDLVYGFIHEFIKQKGHAPSQREIARGCYLAQSSVRYHLSKLQADGRIHYNRGKARALSIGQ